jgi:hypothetical protein
LRSLPVFAASQEIPHIFMEHKSSLPYSQVPATCPYLELNPSTPHDPSNFLKIHLNIILPSTSGSPQWPLSLWLPQCAPLSSHIRVTCPDRLILLDFTTRTILGKEYRSFFFFYGATARGGPWPPLQYASKPLDPLLYHSIRLFPSFSGP